jgi:MinD-like ATPase involved in chromosome partitioning or flagellar assembly
MTTTTAFQNAARASAYVEEATVSRPDRDLEPEAALEPTPADGPEVDAEQVEAQEEAPIDIANLTSTAAPTVARTGWRGLLGRTGIKLAPGAAERTAIEQAERLRESERVIRQATFPRAVGILVANRKGGVGKTPTSLILGGILASIRGGSVAVIEVSDDPGTLIYRAEGSPCRGLGELTREYAEVHSMGSLANYTAPQTSFASVIGTTGIRPRLDANDVLNASAVIDRYHQVRVMDSGNQPSSSAFDGALAVTDALVVPVLNSAEAVLEAIALLDYLRARGGAHAHLADTATVVRLTDGRVENPQVASRLGKLLDQHHVAQVFEVPFDPHIAERGPITLDRLAPGTRDAFTHLAAGVVHTLQTQSITTRNRENH